jgi:DNA methylase
MTDDQLEQRIRAGLADAAAEVEPTGTLAGLQARIHSNPLERLAQARDALEASRDLAEVKAIRDVAVAAAQYARARKLGAEAERYAAEIATRAERRMGQLLKVTPTSQGVHSRTVETPRKDIGYSLSARSQMLARMPDEEFERRMADARLKASADRLARIQRDSLAEQRRVRQARERIISQLERPRVDIRLGDFREVLADIRGVDAVITDPPYERAALPLLADLARWADDVLTPGGVLAVLFGQAHLPDVYRLLDGARPYRWTACYLTPGGGYVASNARVQSNWKPLLVYGGGPRFGDVIRADADGGSRAKDLHKWGQNFEAFGEIVQRLTAPGQTVADPFMGAGTTLLAAVAHGRHAVGADVDPAAVATARERLG